MGWPFTFFDFSIDQLPRSKMGSVDYTLCGLQQEAVNMSTYGEQFIVTKKDAIKTLCETLF